MSELLSSALVQVILLSLPFLVAGLLISLLVGFFQTITQIQDATLSFVPKLLLLLILIAAGLPWFMGMVSDYTSYMFQNISLTSG